MHCSVIGDRIAVGTAPFMPDYAMIARSGISNLRFVQTMLHPIGGDVVAINLAANDAGLPTAAMPHRVRQDVAAARVVWLLPNIRRSGVRDAIEAVAPRTVIACSTTLHTSVPTVCT
jgi:hypothetical protein